MKNSVPNQHRLSRSNRTWLSSSMLFSPSLMKRRRSRGLQEIIIWFSDRPLTCLASKSVSWKKSKDLSLNLTRLFSSKLLATWLTQKELSVVQARDGSSGNPVLTYLMLTKRSKRSARLRFLPTRCASILLQSRIWLMSSTSNVEQVMNGSLELNLRRLISLMSMRSLWEISR